MNGGMKFGAMALLPFSLWATVSGTVQLGMGVNATPISNVKLILEDNNTAGPKQDSTMTNSAGAYTFSNPGANGQKVILVNQSGYNASVTAFAYNGTNITGQIVTLSINSNTSTITGTVVAASNSAPIDSAVVTLSGGVLAAPDSVYTNALGQYTFDSIGTGTGYLVSARKTGYNVFPNEGGIAAIWDSTTKLGSLTLATQRGKISGTITSDAVGNSVIKTGVSLVFYSNGMKIDSVVTDTFGNYSDSLLASTVYTIRIFAAGYKSDSDLIALDTADTVSYNASSTLNATLTSATASLGGTFTVFGLPANSISGAKLYLQRRSTNFGVGSTVYWIVDSTMTDSNGRYEFLNLIAGLTANYRVRMVAGFNAGYVDTVTANTSVAAGAAVTLNFDIYTGAINPTSWLENSLSLRLSESQLSFTLPGSFSNQNSAAAIYTISGNKLVQSFIGSKSNFSMPIGNLGEGKYFLEVKDAKDRVVEPFEISR